MEGKITMTTASRARLTLIAFMMMLVIFPGITGISDVKPHTDLMRGSTTSDDPKIFTGGSIEKIEVIEYGTLNDALSAINSGTADILGQMIQPDDYSVVDSFTNVKKQWAYDSECVVLSINTQHYPLSNEHLRRAIAYAVDKNNISEYFPRPVAPADFLVPLNDAQSPEAEEGGIFYDSVISMAVDELGLGGMVDVDSDGFVEAPNGMDFTLTIAVPAEVEGMNMTAENLQNNLQAAGIDVLLWYTNSTSLQSGLADHTLDYQLALYSIDLPEHRPNWAIKTFYSKLIGTPGENIANFNDSDYDAMLADYFRAYNPELNVERLREGFMMLRDKSPVIPLFFYKWLSVYTDANFEGWLNDTNAGAYSLWNPVLLTPRSSANTLKVAVLPSYFDNFFTSLNPFRSQPILNDAWLWKSQFNPYLLIYDSPLAVLPDGTPVPRAASSWEMQFAGMNPELGGNQTRTIFRGDSLANFTDGAMITSLDYQFSFETYASNSLLPDYIDFVGVKVVGNYETSITMNGVEHYIYNAFGLMPIIPHHIWNTKDVLTWDPTVSDVVGSGPYKVESFTEGSSLVLTINTGYYPSEDHDAPELVSLSIYPDDPIPAISVTIRVFIYDRSQLESVVLTYTYEEGTITFNESVEMSPTSTGYTAVIPPHLTSSYTYFSINATDSWGNSAIVATGYYDSTPEEPEPFINTDVLVLSSIILLVVVVVVAVKRRG